MEIKEIMEQIKLNDKKDLRALRDAVQEALSAVGEATGTKIKVGKMTYEMDGSMASIKVEVSAPNADGDFETAEARDFRRHAREFGLTPEDLGREFKVMNKTYVVCGLTYRARKYPILAKNSQGRAFKFAAAIVRSALEAV